MNNVIEIKNLKKEYKSFNLNIQELSIPSGLIVGLIGENGAGKTTLLKSILNIIKIDKGNITIFGKEHKDLIEKEDIGIVLDNIFLPEILSPKDTSIIMKDIYAKWDETLYQKYLKDFKIPESKPIKTLSKGMRKKLEIAVCLSHHPKLMILDEPTSGLDPVSRSEVLEIFQKFIEDEEHTIIFSTHITSDLEHIADHIIFIDNGKKVLDSEKDEIIDNYGILKCKDDYFAKIDREDIIKYKKNKYDYEILIKDKNKMKKKYDKCIIDKITLEDLMVLMIKGSDI